MMDIANRIVIAVPLNELWNSTGLLPLRRLQVLSEQQITKTLRTAPVQFVVATMGTPPKWIPIEDCYEFWKGEVKRKLISPRDAVRGFCLEDYPDEQCFLASEWVGEVHPVVLLESYH